MRVGEPVELLMHRGQHLGVLMPKTRHRGAGRSVDILFASAVADDDALGACSDRVGMADLTMRNACHVVLMIAGQKCRQNYPSGQFQV